MSLTVIATITAHEGREADVRAGLEELLAPTRAEAGCRQYDLHSDPDAPHVFVMVERWDSEEALAAHLATDHIAAFGAKAGDAVAGTVLKKLTPIG